MCDSFPRRFSIVSSLEEHESCYTKGYGIMIILCVTSVYMYVHHDAQSCKHARNHFGIIQFSLNISSIVTAGERSVPGLFVNGAMFCCLHDSAESSLADLFRCTCPIRAPYVTMPVE